MAENDRSSPIPKMAQWLKRHTKVHGNQIDNPGNAGWTLRSLDIRMAGIDYLSQKALAGTECSPTHLIYWVLEGSVMCNYGAGFQRLKAGEVAICPALRPHWIRLDKGEARGVWIHLDDVERWRFLHDLKSTIRPAQESQAIGFIMERCITEGSSREFGSYENAVHYTEILGVLIMRECSNQTDKSDLFLRQKLNQLQREVQASLHLKWNVALMAAKVHLSERYLHQLCPKLLGSSPMEFVTRLRMDHAIQRLANSNITLEALAAEVGYQSSYAFSDAFLRYTGKRPGGFRK